MSCHVMSCQALSYPLCHTNLHHITLLVNPLSHIIEFSLLTSHYSLLTSHFSPPFITHFSLLTTHFSLLTTHFSLLTSHHHSLLLIQVNRTASMYRSPPTSPTPSHPHSRLVQVVPSLLVGHSVSQSVRQSVSQSVSHNTPFQHYYNQLNLLTTLLTPLSFLFPSS